MLTRFHKRNVRASKIAANILFEYGNDVEAASDRVLEIVNGQKWLERLVLREIYHQTNPKRQRRAA